MSFTFRVSLCLLALSLNFINPNLAKSQPAPSTPAAQHSSDEAALRALAEAFFGSWAAKDLDGYLGLWSAKAPGLEARKKDTRELFVASERIEARNLAMRKIEVSGARALARVSVEARVIEAKTGKERAGYGKMRRTLECVREENAWKVWREVSTFDELADALFTAKTDVAREALLTAETELVTPELSQALSRISDRLRAEKQYAQALTVAQLALKLAEQLNDRAGQGSAWEMIGRSYYGQLDFSRALEHYKRGLALFEGLEEKRMVSILLGRIAACYSLLENHQAALENDLKRLKINEELNDRELIAVTLDNIAGCHFHLGNYQDALEIGQRSLKLYEELDNGIGIARVLILRGAIQLEQSDYDQAIATYQRAAALFVKHDAPDGAALASMNIGDAYHRQGDYKRALDAFQKALADYTELRLLHRMAEALYNTGMVYLSQTDYEMARDYFQRSLTLSKQSGRPLEHVEALSAIGASYRRQGNYGSALDYLRQGLKLLEKTERKIGIATALAEMGDLYFLQGDENQALEFYQRSQALFEQLGSKEKIAALVTRGGNVQQRRGNHRQALAAYEQSLSLYKTIGSKHGMAEALAALGDSHLSLKQIERAWASYRESLTLFEVVGNKTGMAASIAGLARVEQSRGDYSKALSAAESAASLAEKTGALELLWEVNNVIGMAHLGLQQIEQARQAFEQAVATIELMRGQAAGGEVDRRYFLASRLAPYHALVELLIKQGSSNDALTWAERSKSRVLLDCMQSGRPGGWVDERLAKTADEQQQERKLRSELVSLNAQLVNARQAVRPDQARVDALKAQLDKARLRYEAFHTSLYAAHPELRVQRGEASIIKAEEQAALMPDTSSALLEYVVADDQTYLFAITKAIGQPETEVQVYTIPIKLAELAKQTESFRGQLAGRDLSFRDSARKLYDLLLKPAQESLRGKSSLVIVPDDTLWELPFQALLDQDGRFVIERNAVSYAPSLTVLREMKAQRNRRQAEPAGLALLALGNPSIGKETIERPTLAMRDEKLTPLPEAEQEVKALGRLYGMSRSKVYIGVEAREDRVKSEAGEAGILHFATHGILNNASPMYSHLVLAQGDTNEDGLLEAWELMRMDLRADLAVLSACETARGRVGAGEGMIGLTWALFVAGVPSTVVSQWKVESASTRDLMLGFHRQLRAPALAKAKVKKAEALRLAALKVMKNPETSHPFYWASFVLVGDGR